MKTVYIIPTIFSIIFLQNPTNIRILPWRFANAHNCCIMSVSFVLRGVFGIVTDLTVGKPGSVLFRFTFPLLLSVVFQQFYNIVDSIIAGHYIGVNALAAVGASAPITMLFLAIANGMNIGCSVVISQYFGGKHMTHMKSAVSTAVIASAGLSLVLTGIGRWLSPLR